MAKRRMRFVTWCAKDTSDERLIKYSLKTKDNDVVNFTSDDLISHSMMVKLSKAWIDTIELVGNEYWNVLLYEA